MLLEKTRICKICGVEKQINDFANNGKRKRYTCKECETKRNLKKYRTTVAYVQSLKNKCEICGYDKDKSVLEFHHVDESTKLFSIGSFAAKRIWSEKVKQLIDDEVKKCRCLCANCHREIHSNMISEDELLKIDFSFKKIDKDKLTKHNYISNIRKFSDGEIREIRSLAISKNCKQIAQKFNCHPKTITRIINHKTYRDVK